MKAPRFTLTRSARNDLEEIWEYIARDSVDAADRVLREIEQAVNRLGETPGIGHLRPDLSTLGSRFFAVYSYLLVYRAEAQPIIILRVLHGARDVQTLLEAESGEE